MKRLPYYVVNEGVASYCVIDGFTGQVITGRYRRQQDASRAADLIQESRLVIREAAELLDGWAL